MSRGWVVTLAAVGINLAVGILYTWSVISKAIPADWGWTETQKSWPYAIACLVFSMMMVPAGRLQDQFSPRLVATFGGLLVGLGMILASRGQLAISTTSWVSACWPARVSVADTLRPHRPRSNGFPPANRHDRGDRGVRLWAGVGLRGAADQLAGQPGTQQGVPDPFKAYSRGSISTGSDPRNSRAFRMRCGSWESPSWWSSCSWPNCFARRPKVTSRRERYPPTPGSRLAEGRTFRRSRCWHPPVLSAVVHVRLRRRCGLDDHRQAGHHRQQAGRAGAGLHARRVPGHRQRRRTDHRGHGRPTSWDASPRSLAACCSRRS